jgi:hypothetical protein
MASVRGAVVVGGSGVLGEDTDNLIEDALTRLAERRRA